jgi:hypothetical protein
MIGNWARSLDRHTGWPPDELVPRVHCWRKLKGSLLYALIIASLSTLPHQAFGRCFLAGLKVYFYLLSQL